MVIMGVPCILFGFTSSLYLQGLFIFILSMGCSIQNITINIAALDCFRGDNSSAWLQIICGCFGIGGLIGPFIVYIF